MSRRRRRRRSIFAECLPPCDHPDAVPANRGGGRGDSAAAGLLRTANRHTYPARKAREMRGQPPAGERRSDGEPLVAMAKCRGRLSTMRRADDVTRAASLINLIRIRATWAGAS